MKINNNYLKRLGVLSYDDETPRRSTRGEAPWFTPDGLTRPMNFDIETRSVTAGLRRFRAQWTLDTITELETVHDIDIETELAATMLEEMAIERTRQQEIDGAIDVLAQELSDSIDRDIIANITESAEATQTEASDVTTQGDIARMITEWSRMVRDDN